MTTTAAIAGLIHYNSARSKQKTQAVLDAVAELRESPRGRITKSIVARHAGVSREFIYAHPDLRQLIDAAARELLHNTTSIPSENASIDGLRAQNQTFAAKISDQKSAMAHLRSTIQELQRQRQHYLGDALAHSTIDIGDHQRLQADHDRLAAENIALRHQVLQQDNLLAELREDLAASRRAHAEDLAHQNCADGTVPLHGRRV
ncbi:hypothetical protein D092_20955 [Rhodococcus ruber Chol-4]|uniref:Transposase n=2 Tax=Rhodococcus TaxID=1827 RepID=H0JYC5_9NOCA|nr:MULTISPECIES: DUF6262 family protein [Rhodococcus]AWG99405.1 hypothetical protein DCN13_13015 [Rhodococcus ruber]AWH00553.1 hypothetical protein DCN13_19300 [Rhodococcus ruber]EHK80586.1 hypothetical protein AK37_23849 [Rhodococcus pyridinivorans AK37]KXF84388.1 hypothetical protein D092_20955 [Rhodococcus ruber Chol-4]MBP2214693.1 chromosome segregation ATPase [Rhodococcus ruber]